MSKACEHNFEERCKDCREADFAAFKSTNELERCICANFHDNCSHEGQCKESIARGISDNYCDDCLVNAMAEVMV
jgi:hypothetical protein